MKSESIEEPDDNMKISGFGWCVIGILCFGTFMGFMNPMCSHRPLEVERIASCRNNLKQMGLVFRMYANEHEGEFPPLSDEPGNLMTIEALIIPEFLSDETVLVCPSTEYRKRGDEEDSYVDDRSYVYLSHIISSEAEGLAYVEAYRRAALEGNGFDHDFKTPDGDVIPRIRLGDSLERDSPEAAKIPVMIERLGNHEPKVAGGNVLFLDGHVEFMKLDSGFPMTTSFLDALESIDK